ncbi:ATP-dependent DNA helicase RecG [Sandarakinorhabdus cyanobacteriorum]|uniref:Probable DNA 3'-5' helicase RecG n=1 Tax=Sandarakinorhabdus cyanobacteriorum TaxID=1981098 RepID=A0A255Y688_9SPHN|nr:ATP-dependent DNA helicase RecG [Sandarakinorhabdus cyanobacteriorum]OYQ24683.1 ATP-dependent DNA helicase RecG [Sandarakinorhabdus cyanobacteriorum]
MRPDILNPLFAEVSALKGVGSAQVRQLARLKIARVIDLAFHLPTMMIERQSVERLDETLVGQPVIVPLTPARHDRGGPRSPLRVAAVDRGGQWVDLVYFGQTASWAQTRLPIGVEKRITGKLDRYGQKLQIAHPEVAAMDAGPPGQTREPVYPLTEGVTNRRMGQLVAEALGRVPALPEWIEPSVLARQGWAGFAESLAAAHRMERGRDRLAYDELLANQLALMLVRQRARSRKGRALPGTGQLADALRSRLPWPLTGAQTRVIGEILGDMAQAEPMLRLVQGDVGSGKTLVALFACLAAIESGAQAALLAPTEILARQHHATLIKLGADLGIRIALLTGRDKGKVREQLLADLAAGRINLLVGTHAIFQEAVDYHDLGLVVVDEQHRFGVAQRLTLAAKGRTPPHVLAMTATPIPRSLALTRFGEMDQSMIDERPPGRQPIETRVMGPERLEELIAGLARHVEGGGQAYWVCPLVEGSEDADEAAATTRAAFLKARLGEARVGLVHGQMKGPEKDAVMADFAAGRLALLVATTVIEVGVDVPNATLMIIEAAERFGLAQLHQLRGRVGRGSGLSRCLLLRGDELSETARSRLKLMRETNDGFRIAEEDLKLRGAGEILGTRQSGEEAFRFADPVRVQHYVGMARADARLLLDRDGGLDGARGQAARLLLYLFDRDAGVAMLRGG